jgi:hypothetical protein
MKMETVIRSPQKGVVAKLAHKPGVCIVDGVFDSRMDELTQHRIFARQGPYSYYLKKRKKQRNRWVLEVIKVV